MIKEYFYCKKCERGIERVSHQKTYDLPDPQCCGKVIPQGEGSTGEKNLREKLCLGKGGMFSAPPITQINCY